MGIVVASTRTSSTPSSTGTRALLRERLLDNAAEALSVLALGVLEAASHQEVRALLRAEPAERPAFVSDLIGVVLRSAVAAIAEARDLLRPDLDHLFTATWHAWPEGSEVPKDALELAKARLTGRGQPGFAPFPFGDLAAEELGALYEGLLARGPVLRDGKDSALGIAFVGESTPAHAVSSDSGRTRRRSGSYYTPEDLVNALLDEALEPLVQATVRGGTARSLFDLAIVDPACGCGFFLLAAGRRLALAACERAPGAPVSTYDEALERAVRDCLYGVDVNSTALEICKVSLWIELGRADLPPSFLDEHVRVGNSLLGATAEVTSRASSETASEGARADAWCAGFLRDRGAPLLSPTADMLAKQHRFFHWHLAFRDVFERGGFDLVLGNPPWIAHAGRAAQPLDAGIKAFYRENFTSFSRYPTTHGAFIERAAKLLRPGGYLGLVLPSSVSELDGYGPTRAAHDRFCAFEADLVDFGEGRFPGVTQPSMALVSRRVEGGRRDAPPGAAWPVSRPDLTDVTRRLLARFAESPALPPELVGERGVQSDRALAEHFRETPTPEGRFDTPIREGTDIREFALLAPRYHVDRAALGSRIRAADEFSRVRLLIRQTARFPIAALSDGAAFRNSILAGFETPDWPAPALVALLNSAFVRWLHFMRFRDARQPVLPQVKIAHLRRIPEPANATRTARAALTDLGQRLSQSTKTPSPGDRRELDLLVAELYGLATEERAEIERWHEDIIHPVGRGSRRSPRP